MESKGGWTVISEGGWTVTGEGGWTVISEAGWTVISEAGWTVVAGLLSELSFTPCVGFQCFYFVAMVTAPSHLMFV